MTPDEIEAWLASPSGVAAVEAGAEAVLDACTRSFCLGVNATNGWHAAQPIWADRADPPEDYDRWAEFAAARVLSAVLVAGLLIPKEDA